MMNNTAWKLVNWQNSNVKRIKPSLQIAEAYLGSYQTSVMESFADIVNVFLAFNYFRIKTSSQMFGGILRFLVK